MYVIRKAQEHHRNVELHLDRKVGLLVRASIYHLKKRSKGRIYYSTKLVKLRHCLILFLSLFDQCICNAIYLTFLHNLLRLRISTRWYIHLSVHRFVCPSVCLSIASWPISTNQS